MDGVVQRFSFVLGFLIVLQLCGCSFLKPPRTEYYIRYPVQRGDTLSGISDRFLVSVNELQRVNDIDDPRELAAGSIIRVPFNGQSPKSASEMRASLRRSPSKQRRSASTGRKVRLQQARNYVGALAWPVSGKKANSQFGWRWGKFHEGMDIAAPMGTPIRAAHAGQVVYSGRGIRGYGYIVVIRGQGLMTVYAHNRRNRVRAGRYVERGDRIADVGQSGKASGPHLHFETRVKDSRGKNVAVDPMVFY